MQFSNSQENHLGAAHSNHPRHPEEHRDAMRLEGDGPAAHPSRLAALAPQDDGLRRTSAISPRDAPELCYRYPPSEYQRAWGMPGAQCTRSLVCETKQTHELVTTGHRNTRHSRTQWFYGLLRALPGDQA